MKKLGCFMLCALLMLAVLPACAGASFGEWVDDATSSVGDWLRQSGELEVRGSAVRTVSPDTVTVQLGVAMEAASEKEAQDQANEVIRSIQDALEALEIPQEHIRTSSYNITRRTNRTGLLAGTTTYVANQSLTVKLMDFDLINPVLDQAVALGANNVGNVRFSYSKEGEAYQEALRDAILAARGKAEVMAETAGVRLYTLISLREGTSNYVSTVNAYAPMAEEASDSDAGTSIQAGELEISATVTLLYQIK